MFKDIGAFSGDEVETSTSETTGEIDNENVETRFTSTPKGMYPIFDQQLEYVSRSPDAEGRLVKENLGINETLSRMVSSTFTTISMIMGEGEGIGIPKPDHVIYLDKSARPVNWLVKEFWHDFTNEKMPDYSFLAIDRKDWFRYAGVELDDRQYIDGPNGEKELATASDFHIEKIPREMLAKIRALYIDGGIENEDVEEIMSTPTVLNGQDVMVIDEVSRSGSTLGIAEKLIRAAIPEVKSVTGFTFWKPGSEPLTRRNSEERQLLSVPAWYPSDDTYVYGRGVLDPDEDFYRNQFEENPTNLNRAKKFGAIAIGKILDFDEEPEHPSRELMNEIHLMHEEYQKGHILPLITGELIRTRNGKVRQKILDDLKSWGVVLAPPQNGRMSGAPLDPHSYTELKEKVRTLPSGRKDRLK